MPKTTADIIKNKVRQHFINVANSYDIEAGAVIIKNDIFQAAIINSIPFDRAKPLSAVDLGCGTGITLKEILTKWRQSTCIGIDFSPAMIEQSQNKLDRFGDRVTLNMHNIIDFNAKEQLDLIISAFTIHNLRPANQMKVFKNIGKSLNIDGVFIHADFIKFKDSALMKLAQEKYLSFVKGNLMGHELDYWLEHIKGDTPTTVSKHIEAFQSVGEFKFELVRLIGNQILYKATKVTARD